MQELPSLSRAVAHADSALLDLPERIVQFGTGGFLRGFFEYFIDSANRQELFGGRIVAVGSTGSGRDRTLNEQDGLYTLAMRGLAAGEAQSTYQLITSLSRALSATTEWQEVLECARNPDLELIVSNTTEAGIRVDANDVIGTTAPKSFPAKLTQFLYERAKAFGYSPSSAPVVLPCELIENNGARLKELVAETAGRWGLERDFTAWLEHVPFCNTLVDRIVPGEPEAQTRAEMWRELGYRDELLTVSEVYRLFAIEADEKTARRLRFAAADPGIVMAADITPYRQRKVRLLNGTHTISVPLALLAGCESVAEAVNDELVGAFIRRVLFNELVVSTNVENAEQFARDVLDRFANPFIRHALLDITLQQTMKLRVRIVPAIVDYFKRTGQAPASIAFGFAAYRLLISSGDARVDDEAERARANWLDPELWGTDLSRLGNFVALVETALAAMKRQGVRAALEQHMAVQQAV